MASNRARNWNVVINADKLPKSAEIEQKMIEIKAKNYAFIFHDKDKNKRNHIHLVIEFENARDFTSLQKRFETWHIEKCLSLVASIQYLTHKNDTSKEQYELENIFTNNRPWLEQNYMLVNDYINDEKQLIMEISSGMYEDLMDVILSEKYSMEWLNRRYNLLLMMFANVKQLQMKVQKAKADKFFNDRD